MVFTDHELLPGIHHIEDCMGVCFTLIVGAKEALLVDTGYGFSDVAEYVQTITSKPLTLWLTHAHHDHAMGARWFETVRLHPAEVDIFREYTAEPWARHVIDQAIGRGIKVDEASWQAKPMPRLETSTGETLDLGGLSACVMHCPGHTPGSMVVYVPEAKALLTGDDWNPCTWLFFREALPVRAYRQHLRGLMKLPFEYVICPHRTSLYPRRMLEVFLNGLTDEAIDAAPASDAGRAYGVKTREVSLPEDQVLVFDGDKA